MKLHFHIAILLLVAAAPAFSRGLSLFDNPGPKVASEILADTDGKLAYNGAIDDDPDGSKPTKINYVDKALAELTAYKKVTVTESKPYGCTVKY